MDKSQELLKRRRAYRKYNFIITYSIFFNDSITISIETSPNKYYFLQFHNFI